MRDFEDKRIQEPASSRAAFDPTHRLIYQLDKLPREEQLGFALPKQLDDYRLAQFLSGSLSQDKLRGEEIEALVKYEERLTTNVIRIGAWSLWPEKKSNGNLVVPKDSSEREQKRAEYIQKARDDIQNLTSIPDWGKRIRALQDEGIRQIRNAITSTTDAHKFSIGVQKTRIWGIVEHNFHDYK